MVAAPRPSMPFRSVNRPGAPGYREGLQRHHLLPCQVLTSQGLGAMIARLQPQRIGFHDFRRNGLLLPASDPMALRLGLPLHRGPHRHYNQMVIERIGQIEAAWTQWHASGVPRADIEVLARLDMLQRALRRSLLDPARRGGVPLSRRDPARDYAHLDRMADALWGATQAAQAGIPAQFTKRALSRNSAA